MIETRIREMKDSDAGEVAVLCGQLGYPTTVKDVAEVFAEIRKHQNQVVLVAEIDKVIGWVHVILFATLGSGLCTELGGLVVDDAYRGLGVGTILMRSAEEWSAQRGYTAMRFTSQMKRVGAHKFYESLGYNKVKQSFVFEKKLP